VSVVATWNPNIPAALLLLVMLLGMFAGDICEFVWSRRFFSPERRRIENVSRSWTEPAEVEWADPDHRDDWK
jgi:membrane protein DedA with SNARE-associated domain